MIPVEVYEPDDTASCAGPDRCPVAIISAGYGVAHTGYQFIARAYLELGFLVVAVRHELPGDPPLSVEGNLYETRQENWRRGVANLKAVHRTLKERFPRFDFEEVTLIGHSNGGDISAWLANREPGVVKELITLDHRRVPLPRATGLRVLSIRAGDFPADPSVIPDTDEQKALGMCIVTISDARHNDMSDSGPPWLKKAIHRIVRGYSSDGTPCSELKDVGESVRASSRR